jgi:hypothetical protein
MGRADPATHRIEGIYRGVSTHLAADLARVLADEPSGLSCNALAAELHRRRADVLAALKTDRRFVRSGATNAALWRLVANGARTEWDGTPATTMPGVDPGLATRLEVIEGRLAALERCFGAEPYRSD